MIAQFNLNRSPILTHTITQSYRKTFLLFWVGMKEWNSKRKHVNARVNVIQFEKLEKKIEKL